jgi:anti-sigma regulatory factor (Ser/Thr protein kinase)
VIPIIVGDELLGILAADNCLRGRPMPEGLLEPLFLYASLSALPLFALYQQQEHERTEALRREFLREMLSAVTDGKIHLCTQDEIEEQWPSLENPIRVETQGDVPTVRDAARQTALRAGMTHERTANFELCAAEAASNALLHGSGGVAAFGRDEKCVRVRMTDWGAGIPAADLPPALLLAGKTSKVSAGLGYTLIVEDADHLYIHTSPKGTTVIVEMAIEEEIKIPDAWNHLF